MNYTKNPFLTKEDRTHEARYFRPPYWKDNTGKGIEGDFVDNERITHQQWNNLVTYYKEHGKLVIKPSRRDDYAMDNAYYIDDKGNQPRLYVADPRYYKDSNIRVPNGIKYYYCMEDDEKNQDQSRKGLQSFRAVYDHFLERTKEDMTNVFGLVTHSFDLFQLPPIVFANTLYRKTVLKNVSKADFSSAYPAAMCGKLPTSIGSIRRKGRIKPTAEYPFAFYTKSHNMAIYDEFDTFNWKDIDFGSNGSWKGWTVFTKDSKGRTTTKLRQFFTDTKEEEEETILMKAAKFTLDEEMNWLYEQKKNGEEAAKSMMVCSIGYMRSLSQNKNYYAHLTAICYARHIYKMIKAYQFLKDRGRDLIMVATDCMAWIGKGYEGELTTKEKNLGNFVLEYTGVNMDIVKCGQYAIFDPITNDIYLVKHQGLSEEKVDIVLKDIKDIEKLPNQTVYRYYNKKTKFWEEVEYYEYEY